MQTVFGVLAGLGLAAACGFRVFVPLLVASVAVHAGYLQPAPEFAWLGTTPALVSFAVATAMEVGAYYVPWLDHALDTLATPASVVAGALVASSVAVDMDPFMRWTVGIVAGGGLAAAVQAGTVVMRGWSFASTAGVANPVVATAELGGALATSAVSVVAPGLAILGLVAVGSVLVTAWMRRRRQRASV